MTQDATTTRSPTPEAGPAATAPQLENVEEEASGNGVATLQVPRQKPTKALPTDRIAFPKQLDLLRAYAVASGPNKRQVSLAEVAALIKMNAATISLANAFFTEIGLLIKGEGGKYLPGQAVIDYARAYEWDQSTAGTKLAPVLASAWFGQVLVPRLQFSKSMTEAQVTALLGQEAEAVTYYAKHLGFIIEYLVVADLVRREGGNIVLGSRTSQVSEPIVAETTIKGARDTEQRPSTPIVQTAFSQAPEGKVQFYVNINVDMAEISRWSPDRIAAFFAGLAQVLAAKGSIEKESANSK